MGSNNRIGPVILFNIVFSPCFVNLYSSYFCCNVFLHIIQYELAARIHNYIKKERIPCTHSSTFHIEDNEKMQIHAIIFLIFFIIM